MPSISSAELADGTAGYKVDFMVEKGLEEPLIHLRKQRAATFEQIRKAVPELAERLESWDRAIAALSNESATGSFARHLSGADALVEYLRDKGPTHRLIAIKAVAAGGWAANREDPIGILHDAVDYQLGKAKNAKIISMGADMIGLPEHKKKR